VASLPAPAPEALALFERAMRALQIHRYEEAAGHFRGVLTAFAADRGLCDRSQVYLGLCERELRRRPQAPTTVEERLTAATAALNNDDDAEAERLAGSVLAETPQHDLALYLSAAVAARRGDVAAALDRLAEAVAANPEIRAQARHDADFESLHDADVFRRLVDVSPGAPTFRGVRRGRVER
jgi:tetratricopeptide (TPR) repeat protein